MVRGRRLGISSAQTQFIAEPNVQQTNKNCKVNLQMKPEHNNEDAAEVRTFRPTCLKPDVIGCFLSLLKGASSPFISSPC